MNERPTVFFLHALGSSARAAEPLAARWGDDVEVVAVDLPGFGGRPGSAGVGDTVDQVLAVVAAAAPGRFLVVGHSMGGKIATLVAARLLEGTAPAFGLAGVVLLAGSPPVPEPMAADRRHAMLGWVEGGRPLSAASAREFVDANVGTPLSPDLDRLALEDLRRTDPEAWTRWLAQGSREDWGDAVGTLDVPALIVSGGADGDLGETNQRLLNGAVYRDATFLTVPGVGHLLPFEAPDVVAAAVLDFWRTRAGLGPAVPPPFAATLAGGRTTARTRGVLARRALADDPAYRPAVLTPLQLTTLRSLADVVVPQDPPAIDLAARLDAALAAGIGDGWRPAGLPPDGVAYRLALDALAGFAELTAAQQRDRVTALAAGTVSGGDLTGEQLGHWFEDVANELVRTWLAHPATMARIGWDGFATGGDVPRQQGFLMLGAGTREAWEPAAVSAR